MRIVHALGLIILTATMTWRAASSVNAATPDPEECRWKPELEHVRDHLAKGR